MSVVHGGFEYADVFAPESSPWDKCTRGFGVLDSRKRFAGAALAHSNPVGQYSGLGSWNRCRRGSSIMEYLFETKERFQREDRMNK